MPAQTLAVVGVAGSFAAIATLFGSPLPAAFLLMEAVGLGGAMLDIVLLPGPLAAGIGALIFVGLDAWTGFGTFSLAVPNLPQPATWPLNSLAFPSSCAGRWAALSSRRAELAPGHIH